jgi:DNA topoisomerase I
VLAAVALSVSGVAQGASKTARKRAKTRAIKEAARYLGNTPAVCRASYIDPRVFDRFDGGLTIGGVLPELAEDTGAWPDVQGRVEDAVLDLLAGDRDSDAVTRARDLAA